MRNRIVTPVIAAATFVVMGCSGERELPVVDENKAVSLLDSGEVINADSY